MARKIPVPVFMMSGVKRSANGNVAAPPAKKLHPLFTGGVKELGNFLPSPPTLIHFLHLDPFAPSSSVNPLPTPAPTPASPDTAPLLASSSHEENLGESSNGSARAKVKVVFYDLDGTLIKPKGTNRFPTSREDWAWWHPSVPNRLKAEWEDGKHLVVISNQGDAREKIRKEWKAKLSLIVAKMPQDVPIRVLAALNKYDIYRKPNVGMYQVVKQLYEEKGLAVDLENSLFVGDAAGRLGGGKGKVKDHSDTDYKFALNVGVKFVTPEEYFLGEPKQEYPEPPNGFLPSKVGSLANLPPVVPSNKPIVRTEKEIVLFVGPPASGKTSFFKKHFAPRGYEHINQDLMGRREKCLIAAEASLASGKSVVIGTGRLEPSGFHSPLDFTRQYALAKHNSVYRANYAPKTNPPRELLPGSAFSGYVAQFQDPSLDEGFDELRGVNFVFEGSEDERKKWDMWMLEVK